MADRPILFSSAMVRALLDGRKTQTRRIIEPCADPNVKSGDILVSWPADQFVRKAARFRLRFREGDQLWVRESIGRRTASLFGIEAKNGVEEACYIADDADVVNADGFNICPWWDRKGAIPGIHMPRWASRLTLTVTDVRVQRLQEISEADAIAEGAGHAYGDAFHSGSALTDRRRFELLWTDINGADSWDANPWIAAVSFTVERRNIDALPTDGAPVGSTAAGKPRLAADGS